MPIPAKKEMEKRQSAKMKVYYTLREWIMYGTLEPGEQLNDQELSEYFEISRTPVREALQMLENQKLVVIYPNKGTVVSSIDLSNLGKWYLPLAHLHALAAQLACDTITSEQLTQLRQMDQAIMEHVEAGDVAGTLRADVKFHIRILELVDNEFIMEFSEILMLHIQRIEYYLFSRTNNHLMSFTQHTTLLDALEKRDAQAAHEAMLANWLSTLERYNRTLNQMEAAPQPEKTKKAAQESDIFVLASPRVKKSGKRRIAHSEI